MLKQNVIFQIGLLRPQNHRLTLSTHLMIKPNLCGTTIFVSLFFSVLYHSSGKQQEMKELTHAF